LKFVFVLFYIITIAICMKGLAGKLNFYQNQSIRV